MKTAIFLVLIGCAMAQEVKVPSPTPPADMAIKELDRYAKRRGYWWRIFCTEKHQFQAEMCPADCELYYAEEGSKGRWAAQGETQAAAARNLLYGSGESDRLTMGYWMHRASWHAAPHLKLPESENKCPKMLSGGPQ